MYKTSIVWLRRDLRLYDHRPFSNALTQSENVVPVFVFDSNILSQLNSTNDRRVSFIFESVMELKKHFQGLGSDLIVLYGDPKKRIPELAKKLRAEAVFCGKDYESYAKTRDQFISHELKKFDIVFIGVKDHVVFEELEIKNQSEQPYKVFTPYKNNWLKSVRAKDIEESILNFENLIKQKQISSLNEIKTIDQIGFVLTASIAKPGTKNALKLLKEFESKIEDYKDKRDRPDLNGTSMLSVHLRFGTISIRHAVRICREKRNEGSRTWLSELIWRDFYQMIIDQFPHVEKHSFKPEYENIKWPGKKDHFQKWTSGQTGFPIVDAAMRHFYQTGWMHNRLRMIVASFLVKDLLIDWRQGEKYFAEHLLDFDLAANNGGWQWSASTGCDAQPYFRIFNPSSQSMKFDPNGDFIRKNLPELRDFPNKWIHNPHEAPLEIQMQSHCLIGKDYPKPIVDHSISREKALELFKKTKA